MLTDDLHSELALLVDELLQISEIRAGRSRILELGRRSGSHAMPLCSSERPFDGITPHPVVIIEEAHRSV